jgi:superfamily II DNA or RNA helicase
MEVGIEMADAKTVEKNVVGCIDTILSRQDKHIGRFDLCIIDEAHLNFTKYHMDFVDKLVESGTKIVAMTATPPDGKDLCIRDHYGPPAFTYDWVQGRDDGYLADCRSRLVVLDDLDLSSVKKTLSGDFNGVAINRVMKQKSLVAAVGMTVEKFWEGEASVVFCASIEHATLVGEDLATRGISAGIVHSNMTEEEVQQNIYMFSSGQVDVILNVGMLVLGWNQPRIKKLFIARPCASSQLYRQVFGRGTRLFPKDVIKGCKTKEERLAAIAASEKPFFEVFDLTDASRSHDLKTSIDAMLPGEKPDLLRRVRAKVERLGKTISAEELDPILEAERKAMAQEQAMRERHALQRTTGILGKGSVTAYERDTLADAEGKNTRKEWNPWWMPYGKFKGRTFKKIHAEAPWYLPAVVKHMKDGKLKENVETFLGSEKLRRR